VNLVHRTVSLLTVLRTVDRGSDQKHCYPPFKGAKSCGAPNTTKGRSDIGVTPSNKDVLID
jgi:hypothetical protein